jgi:hypothetical protein
MESSVVPVDARIEASKRPGSPSIDFLHTIHDKLCHITSIDDVTKEPLRPVMEFSVFCFADKT